MGDVVDIGFRFKKINDLLCKKADETMQGLDVTYSQHHVLVYLIRSENQTASLKTLEKKFRVSQATMAGIVKRLEEKEVVTSYTLPNDKRIKMVQLTEKGAGICERSRELMIMSENKMKALYTKEELDTFVSYLDRLYKALNEEDNKNA